MILALAWITAYILGSIPTGMGWTWLFKKIDIRKFGSGRTGGTNVWRTAGFIPALLTALTDGLKGAAAVWVARWLGLDAWGIAVAGTLAVLGHNYSVFLKFHGGAGTATSIGVADALSPGMFSILTLAGSAMMALVGHASVGSILVAVLLPVAFFLRGETANAVACGLPTMLLTVWALRPNIQRLLQGQERFLPIYTNKPPLVCLSRHPAKH